MSTMSSLNVIRQWHLACKSMLHASYPDLRAYKVCTVNAVADGARGLPPPAETNSAEWDSQRHSGAALLQLCQLPGSVATQGSF